ncbi:unnamed protein product [Protopolystoma xenopodis]|uniref:Uncharacterized protein n=1 Tax=Protopolystoma xenopodis TaxID=117903 RepID=A0A448XLF7_9PLAT|nr:unnamed protein product [Protopolystoma xenopodis]
MIFFESYTDVVTRKTTMMERQKSPKRLLIRLQRTWSQVQV